MDEIDQEFADLLRGIEKKKSLFEYDSLQSVIQRVREHFFEHMKGFQPFDSPLDVQEIGEDDGEEYDEYSLLNELVQTDLMNGYLELREGELQISGKGTYMLDTLDGPATCLLDDDEVLFGTIDGYFVAPLIVIDENDEPKETVPAIWMMLNDADVRSADGEPRLSSDRMMVPITVDGFIFKKLVDDESEASSEELSSDEFDIGIVDVKYDFCGHDFQQLCNDIESDLNYNEYEADDLQARRREYQPALSQHMEFIEDDDKLIISVKDAQIPTGGTVDLVCQDAYYNGPTIIKMYNTWRVVHGFTTLDEDEQPSQMIHVYPESIQLIFRSTIN